MIDPITQYILNEGYILSDKTISVNLSKFISRETNHLIIVGVLGSGKTTLGEELAKQLKVKWYSIDSFWRRLKQEHFKEAKSYQDITNEEWDKLDDLFYKKTINLLKSKERFIIEGINLLDERYRQYIINQSMIILGMSSIRAGIRAGIRNKKRGDDGGTWRLLYWMPIQNMKLCEPRIKKLRNDVKKIYNVDIQKYKI